MTDKKEVDTGRVYVSAERCACGHPRASHDEDGCKGTGGAGAPSPNAPCPCVRYRFVEPPRESDEEFPRYVSRPSSARTAFESRAVGMPFEEQGAIDGQPFTARAELHQSASRTAYVDVALPVREDQAPRSMRVHVSAACSGQGHWYSPVVTFSDFINAPFWPLIRGAVDHALSMYARTFERGERGDLSVLPVPASVVRGVSVEQANDGALRESARQELLAVGEALSERMQQGGVAAAIVDARDLEGFVHAAVEFCKALAPNACEATPIADAFLRGLAAERASIVRWLRTRADDVAVEHLADRIEALEHCTGPTP